MGPDVFITTTFSSSMERSRPRDDANPSLPDGAQEPGSEPSAVVVGIDGSNGSSEARRWAIAEARLPSVPLRAIHAWTYSQPLVSPLAGYPYSTESVDFTVDDRWEAEQRLECANQRTRRGARDRNRARRRRRLSRSSADPCRRGHRPSGGQPPGARRLHQPADRLCQPAVRLTRAVPCPVVIVRGRPAQPVSRPTHER
jgi:hypothetical protein